MARIFVSYSRESKPVVEHLVGDLRSLGHEPWFDQELSGGQRWWDQIMEQIRAADVFVIAVDEHALASDACTREYKYAEAVAVPVLPVHVATGISANLLPPALSQVQFVEYIDADRQSAFRLARAFTTLPAKGPLPDPLPEPPEPPMSYLGELAERISSAQPMSRQEQSGVILDLKRGLQDPAMCSDTEILLQRFRERHDILKVIDDEIAELIKANSPQEGTAEPIAEHDPQRSPVHTAVPTEIPEPKPGQRSRSGSEIRESAQPVDSSSLSTRMPAALTFGILGLTLGLWAKPNAYYVDELGAFIDWNSIYFSLFPAAAFGIAGALSGFQPQHLRFWLGATTIIAGATFIMYNSASDPLGGAILYIAPPAALVSAIGYPFLHRWWQSRKDGR